MKNHYLCVWYKSKKIKLWLLKTSLYYFFAVIVNVFGLKGGNEPEDEHEDSEHNHDDYYTDEETNCYLEQEKAREEEEE